MVQHDLAAFKRPLFVIFVIGVLIHASSYNVVECQLNRSPRGLWGDLFGAVTTALGEHVKRQRAREAAIVASSRVDQSAVNTIEENLHSEPDKQLFGPIFANVTTTTTTTTTEATTTSEAVYSNNTLDDMLQPKG